MAKNASLRYLRMSPRKVREVGCTLQGLKVGVAMDLLAFSKRAAAKPLAKLLKSAIVNASKEKGVDIDALLVKRLLVHQGPVIKRFMPRAKGSASPILKRMSHVVVELGEK